VNTGIFRTFRAAPPAAPGTVSIERTVEPAEVEALLEDFEQRLERLTAADPRPELRARFEDPSAVKAVWRDGQGEVLGAALAVAEGSGADVAFMHILPAHAGAGATARLLDELLQGLPPQVARVRAMDRFTHRWLHLPAAEVRRLLESRGFAAFDRVLLARDLARPLPAPPPLPAGYVLANPDPARADEFAQFAFRAYRGTTDFSIIAPDASPDAYARLYRKFLGGELGEYAPPLSLSLVASDGSLAGVLHTILIAREPYVGDLSVLAEHRRRGLGRILLTRGLERYREAGHTRAALTVTAQNTAAYNLYRSLGFEVERSGEVFMLAR